jgi:hypothetical protein
MPGAVEGVRRHEVGLSKFVFKPSAICCKWHTTQQKYALQQERRAHALVACTNYKVTRHAAALAPPQLLVHSHCDSAYDCSQERIHHKRMLTC